MTIEPGDLITAMRLGDSQFPSGGFGFSWGLEALWQARQVRRRSLLEVLSAELEGRWATADRVFVCQAMQAGGNTALRCVDETVEAMAWADSQADGSRRAGAALLLMHLKLDTPGAVGLDAALGRGELLGHLPVIQGALFRGLRLSRPVGLCVAGYGFLSGLAGAAVRLGMAGAVEAQRALAALSPRLAVLADEDPPATATAFSPLTDIAMMRHDRADGALFSN